MQFASHIAFLAAAIIAHASASAIPSVEPVIPITGSNEAAIAIPAAPEAKRSLHARAVTKFLTCKDKDFVNCVTWINVTTGVCNTLPSGWNDVISSVRADEGFGCYIFPDNGCGGNQGGPVTSDNRHRDLYPLGWNDIVSSYRCEPN